MRLRSFDVSLACLLLMGAAAIAVSAQRLEKLEPLDASGLVTYFIADGAPGSQFRASDRQLAVWALQAWERTVGGALRFEAAAQDAALVRVYWIPAGAGQYGEMRPITVNGRRGASVYIRPDTSALGPDIAKRADADPLLREAIVYLTCVHELGHALGLGHTDAFADIMYFFGFGGDIPTFFGRYRSQLATRDDIATIPGLSPGDIQRIRALYAAR